MEVVRDITHIVAKHANREVLTRGEMQVFEQWLGESPEHQLVADFPQGTEDTRKKLKERNPNWANQVWEDIQEQVRLQKAKRKANRKLNKFWVALKTGISEKIDKIKSANLF